jgi:glycerol-3-phosphate acyltransferase PlsY
MLLPLLIAAVVGYLLGSLPFGYLVARAKGVNIFEVGSKSPGATNVRRVLGHGAGNLVMLLDVAKGALAVGWIPLVILLDGPACVCVADETELPKVTGLVAAMLGHAFSCFTRFRGGKSVATGGGGFLVLFPFGALAALAVWGVSLGLTRYVSLASMLAGLTLPIAAFLLHQSGLVIGVSAVVAVFIAVRHRTNIARLLAGTENKVGQNPAAPIS